jgi:DNA-binding NarL/FixJ family response regulator
MQPISTLAPLGETSLIPECAANTQHILVVEDDDAMARCLRRIAGSFGAVTVEATVSGAINQVLHHPIWSAFIVDLCLLDGTGLDVVSSVRADNHDVAVLILTGHSEHRAINAAFDLRAQYLDKPATRAQIETFLVSATRPSRKCNSGSDPPQTTLAELGGLIDEKLARLARNYNLTRIDVDVIRACLHGYSGKEYIERQGLSVNTYKRRARRALRKLGMSSVGEVRDCLLRSL